MTDTKMCPYCGEEVKLEAIKCKHCQSMLSAEDDALVGAAAPPPARQAAQAAPKVKKPIWKRWWAWAVVIVVLFLFIVSSGGEDKSTPSSSAPSSSQPTEEPEVISEAAINEFLAWESEIMNIHTRADNATEAFSAVLTDFGEGKTDIYSTYNEAKRTRDVVESARRDISRVDISSGLSEDHVKRLKDAVFTLSKGLFVKTEGLDLILKFLDDPKPSYVNEATESFNRGYLYMIEGLSEITMVKAELGLFDDIESDQ